MNEDQIRDAVIAKISSTASGAEAAFIAEMFVDRFARRADLVVANGKLAAFEIKSHRDSLERLQGQLESYCRFFEQVTVVCAPRHVQGVKAATSPEIGIWSISDDGQLKSVRSAKVLPQTSTSSWLSFLPVDELRNLLRERRLPRAGRRCDLAEQAKQLPLKDVRSYVLSYLKRREDRIAKRALQVMNSRATAPPPCSADHLKRYLERIGPSPASVALPRVIRYSDSKKSSTLASPLPSESML